MREKGFSLVEVLITLVIMSVGMLGIIGLYVQSMQAGRTSLYRHQAVTLAGDVADRIRANPLAGATYTTPEGDNKMCVGGGIDCSSTDMALNDILLWQAQAVDTLPRGSVSVVFTPGIPATYLITIAWEEPGSTPSYGITIPVLGI